MKRVVALFMVVFMLVGITAGVLAESQQLYVRINIDNGYINARRANLLFNGQKVDSDVPPIIYNDRTLVPIRFVANYLDAEVDWDQQKKEVSIKTSSQDILLTINSSSVLINGTKKQIPYGVPAKLVNDSRTMVPLRFVSEILGCKVDWDQDTRTGMIETVEHEVTGISVKDSTGQMPKIVVNTTGIVQHSAMYLQDPYRLVIDIHNSKLNIADKNIMDSDGTANIEVDKYPIKRVRASQFSNDPNITRLVIDLDMLMGYDIKASDDGKSLVITFTNMVKDIDVERNDGREGIVINNSNTPQYNILRLTSPDRIVVDLLNSTLENENDVFDIKTDFVKGIRVSQFKPDALYNKDDKIVRVVLDIDETAKRPNLMTEVVDNKIVLYADDKSFDNITYQNDDKDGGYINIKAEEETKFVTNYDENKRTLEIKVDEDEVDIKNGLMVVKDDKINTITVDDDGRFKTILVSFKSNVNITAEPNSSNDELNIIFNALQPKYSDKLIVIDAGHGGKDPGTIGITTKVKEKDLNLKVALKLNQKLKELGFNTIMTRDSDEFVDLYERANIANRNNADLFISVHFNANDNRDISGVQTLYCPAYDSEVKEQDNFPLAKAIQDELLKGLNNVDKGIVKRPGLVVIRETKMVAALAELGFVTNPAEEKKVITDEYQEKAAQSLANGIMRYFDENVFNK
jgi:N-acetylmuramoyl-L-alanine amidase